jgi:solute:Na+ symporter, SSS family
MRFVMDYLPPGVVGLLFAVIFTAAMSSSSSELNALGSTTTVDLYKRSIRKEASDSHYVQFLQVIYRILGFWGNTFATYASLFENLIQAVNLLGSLFYGTILGIFIVGFFMKWIKGKAVFIAAIGSQALDFSGSLLQWERTFGLCSGILGSYGTMPSAALLWFCLA